MTTLPAITAQIERLEATILTLEAQLAWLKEGKTKRLAKSISRLEAEIPRLKNVVAYLTTIAENLRRANATTSQTIIDLVAAEFGISPATLFSGGGRRSQVVFARFVSQHIMYHKLHLSYPEIAAIFGVTAGAVFRNVNHVADCAATNPRVAAILKHLALDPQPPVNNVNTVNKVQTPCC